MSRIRNQRGQGLIEYLIIVALVAVATIGVVRVLGQAVSSRFNTITYALQGKKKITKIENLNDSQLEKRDLGDFMNGVAAQDGEK
jgi:pilus assembly protein Flp/PilA